MVSPEREPIRGGLGQTPSVLQRQSPWPEVQGAKFVPQKLNAYLHLHYLRSWPVCPKIDFFAKQKKISSGVWGP